MLTVVAISLFVLSLVNIGLLPLGFALMKRGLWPARAGIDPHCRRCGYLLIGIEAVSCPECGTPTTPENVVYGRRHRAPGWAAVGALIWLWPVTLVVLVASHGLSRIEWYHFKPTFMVMRDLRTPGAVPFKAMNELDRREKNGDLSSKYEQQLAELGLAQQAGTGSGNFVTWTIEFAEKQYQAGKLTEEEKNRLFQQCVQAQLSVKPTVKKGQRVAFTMASRSRITIPYFYVTMRDCSSPKVDDHVIDGAGGGVGFAGLGASGSTGSSVACPNVGTHVLTVVPHIELHDRNETGPVVYREDRVLTAPFTVVESRQ